MKIERDSWYANASEELDVIGSLQTRNRYRHERKGPPYIKVGSRVLYRGGDVLDWLEAHRVPTDPDA